MLLPVVAHHSERWVPIFQVPYLKVALYFCLQFLPQMISASCLTSIQNTPFPFHFCSSLFGLFAYFPYSPILAVFSKHCTLPGLWSDLPAPSSSPVPSLHTTLPPTGGKSHVVSQPFLSSHLVPSITRNLPPPFIFSFFFFPLYSQ